MSENQNLEQPWQNLTVSCFSKVATQPSTPMVATIGEWHSYHLESDSTGLEIMVTDDFSPGWFLENPTHKILTREDGSWGPDPRSGLKLVPDGAGGHRRATEEDQRFV